MMLNTTWAEQDLARHEREQEEWLKSRPVCDQCGEPIQDDAMFEFENETYCTECWDMFVNVNFLKLID